MEIKLNCVWLTCVFVLLVSPSVTDGLFGSNPDPDTDPGDPGSTNEPPFGFVGFRPGGMFLVPNPPQGTGPDSGAVEGTTSATTPEFKENFGCCPTLSKKAKKKNKKKCNGSEQDGCVHDYFCGPVKKCCHDGCKNTCMRPTKMCTDSKKWRADLGAEVKGTMVKCPNCGCAKATALDAKKPGFLEMLCKENVENITKKCCKTCELNFNLGYREPCD